MASARSLADLTLSFGLVSIPVKVFSATESGNGIRFNLIHRGCGSRLRQQYVCIRENVLVERAEMVKGYQFAPEQYVTFDPDELKTLEEQGSHLVDIVGFVPAGSVDPIYFEKAYYLAPDKRGDRPYNLLLEGMRQTGRCAVARWAWHGKSHAVQLRPARDGGIVMQVLLYGDEVRSTAMLNLPRTEVKKSELDLAVMLIEQIAQDAYDPAAFEDEVKKRIEAAIEQKIAGQEITLSAEPERASGNVIDLMEALRASLAAAPGAGREAPAKARKSARKAAPAPAPAPAPARKSRSKK
ncbi:non-homologous end joining protein Ku [Noviherbaspirillum aridicola]|uniref:Non-homologous end joining protein Ku n=1 Tax=Noviherbaspirillum aridicola TaxID=2849687 RepID=A0ABQ4Q0L8_9BURK|nr:Ku protein [Noviherbaspirillum aridicola]GIZ50542.1 non-homologous end joining protein Ku [Noviherbaspirillum aridicola]